MGSESSSREMWVVEKMGRGLGSWSADLKIEFERGIGSFCFSLSRLDPYGKTPPWLFLKLKVYINLSNLSSMISFLTEDKS